MRFFSLYSDLVVSATIVVIIIIIPSSQLLINIHGTLTCYSRAVLQLSAEQIIQLTPQKPPISGSRLLCVNTVNIPFVYGWFELHLSRSDTDFILSTNHLATNQMLTSKYVVSALYDFHCQILYELVHFNYLQISSGRRYVTILFMFWIVFVRFLNNYSLIFPADIMHILFMAR